MAKAVTAIVYSLVQICVLVIFLIRQKYIMIKSIYERNHIIRVLLIDSEGESMTGMAGSMAVDRQK